MTDHIIRTTITVVLQGCAGTFDKTILKELETDLNTAMAADPYDVGGLPEGFTATSSSTSAKVEFDPEDVVADLHVALKGLYRAYVNTLESGRDRIISLGGDCDSVDRMEEGDPALIRARAAIAKVRGAA